MNKDIKRKRFISMLAFFAILFAAVALILSQIFSGNKSLFASIINICKQISYVFAFIVSGIYAHGYIRSKNIVWQIIYIVACISVAVFMILPIFGIGA